MQVGSGIYSGHVRHTRIKPRRFSLRHACFWLALDLDRIAETADRHWNLSHNRFNILSFYDRDHGVGSPENLREQITAMVANAGVQEPPERIILFCMPRVLGYGFNPLSLYFCHDENDVLTAIVYEVHNTFGERHSYVAVVDPCETVVQQSAEKTFYVSPFMDMDLRYAFKLNATPERLSLAINAGDSDGPVIFTSVHADRRDITSGALLTAWISHPLLTLKVITAIHFHALRLWLKGIKLRLRPPPPREAATIGRTGRNR